MTTAAVIVLGIKVSLALTVLAAGMRARSGDAFWLFRRPSLLARTIIAMNVMMPLVAILMVSLLGLNPAVKVALVALSMSPVPPVLPRRSINSGGAASYTIGLLVAVSILSVGLVPFTAWAIGRLFATPVRVDPRDILALAAELILVPLFLGVLLRRFVPAFAERMAKPTDAVATWLLRIAIVPVFVVSWPAIRELLGNGSLLAMLVMALTGLAIGHYVGGPEDDNRIVLALATALRHPAVASAVGQTAFPDNEMLRAAALLAVVVSAVATLPYAGWAERHLWERRHRSIHLSGRRSTLPQPAYQGRERRASSRRDGDRRR
jgi:BASS family bile acid:Na+ symporter